MTQPDKVMTACPSCAAKLAVPTSAVGKKIRCPKCQTVVAITAEMVSQPPQKPSESQAVPAADSEPPQRPDVSLGVENTYAGAAKKNTAPESLGDQATFGGQNGPNDAVIDDDMEVVDLSTRYTIEGVLGKGGMGEVQLATDNRLKRKVAIKRVLGDMAKSQTAVRRFMTEAQSIAALNHPNIVQVYDYGRDKDGPFLILEYVAGNSLLDRCQLGAMPLEEAITLICHLCDGLTRAHELGIIHRDLKPANVLLTKDGVPKLTDFGLARVETGDTGQTMSGAVLGTLDFMPPEQRRDATQADARSDLWSLAATLYQMVTGKSPKVIRLNEVPASLQSALGKALEDKPDDRYQSVAEFRNALREVVDESRATLTNLTEGQCPSCGTKNEVQRKFCRKCAVSLEVKCLSCSKGMPVWDEVCGSCGSKQSPLIASRKVLLQQRQHQAEGFLQEGKYREAAQIGEELQSEADPRFQHLKKWAAEFAEDVNRQQQQQQQRSGTLHKEAKAHQAAHDYSSAIHALEQIPASLRSPDMSAMLNQLQTQEQRSKDLYEEIRLRVERRELDGLMPRVDELLQLLPDRVDLRDLRDTLEKREQQRLASRSSATIEAQRLLDARKYVECVAVLQRVDGNLRTPEIEALQKDAALKLSRLEKLQKTIDQAVKSNQLQGLLAKVEELLLLKSDVTEVDRQLREQLLAREQKQKSQIKALLQKVQQLRKEVRFDEALKMLRRVPAELQTNAITTAIEDLQFFADQRSGAIKGLTQANDRQHIQQALALADEYRGMLTSAIIADMAFESAMKECRRRLEELQEAEELAIRRRLRQKKLFIIGSVVSLLLLVAVAGFIMLRQQRLTAIADAQKRGDDALHAADSKAAIEAYSEVIRLDDTAADAWAGLALAKLQQTPPDVTGAFGGLEKSAALSPDGEKLQQARRLAHTRRAIERANAGSVTEALQDVADAEKLAAPAEEVAAAKLAVSSAYLKRAEEAVAAKQLEAALQELQEARVINPQSDQLPRVSQMIADAYLDRAKASVQQSAAELAMAAIEAAREIQPELPRIPELQAAALVIRAQQALQAGDRDKASADFLEARTLSSNAAGLGVLAASLADGLVKRCEEAFSDASFQEATAALQTVEQIDATSATLPGLRERLSKVLVAESDRAIQAKESDRAAELIKSFVALQVPVDEQLRLTTGVAAILFDECQNDIAAEKLSSAIDAFAKLQKLPVSDVSMTKHANDTLLPAMETLILAGLKSSDFTLGVNALKQVATLAQINEAFEGQLRDFSMTLQGSELSLVINDVLVQTHLSRGLIAHYLLDGNAQDMTEYSGDGIVNGAISTSDRHGNANAAYAFDGKYLTLGSKHIVLPACGPLGKSPRTFSVWAKTATRDTQLLLEYGDAAEGDATSPPGSAFQLTLSYGSYGMTASTGRSAITYQADYTDNQWHHFVWIVPDTAIPTTADIQLFLDGTLVSVDSGRTHVLRSDLAVATSKSKIVLGHQFTGELDDIRIYDRALTSEEVADLFKVEKPADVSRRVAMPGIAVAPFDEAQAKAHQKAWADYLGVPVESTNSIGMKLVVIPPGEFMMGSPESEPGPELVETQHKVTLSKPFQLGCFEVTQAEYEKVMGVNPSTFKGDQNPAEQVNWEDAVEYCRRLSEFPDEKAAGREYRLPTEAEWEYACRAGTTTAYSFGDAESMLVDYAWYSQNAKSNSHPVGQKQPNAWGLFDMLGNVWEWCEDKEGSDCVNRGGSSSAAAATCRSALRSKNAPTYRREIIGFRVACDILRLDAASSQIGKALPASLSEGLVANYPLDGDAEDVSGNRHHGVPTNVNGDIDRFGQTGKALKFSGDTQVKVVLPDGTLSPASDNTISLWVRCDQFASVHNYLFHTNAPAGQFVQAVGIGKDRWHSTYGASGGASVYANYEPGITFAKWYNVALVWGDRRCVMYVNGEPGPASDLLSENTPASSPSNTLLIGALTKDHKFSGAMDDLRIYRRALSAEELKALYHYESRQPGNALRAPPPAIASFDAAAAKAHQQSWADHLGVPVVSTNSIGMKLVVIPPGEFMMGSPASDLGRQGDETHHRVSLARSFQIGAYEVTQTQYEKVMGENPGHFKGPDNPVDTVSWDDAMEFCHRLSGMPKEKAAKKIYRLPTEAEWEFACRAATTTAYSFGDDELKLTNFAWFDDNSGDRRVDRQVIEKMDRESYDKWLAANNFRTHAVGTKDANDFGLYDMHGNVWEWCLDIHAVLPAGFEKDPSGPSSGSKRSTRGGSADSPPEFCRSSSRLGNAPSDRGASLGFRVYCELESSPEPAVAPFDTSQAKANQKAWANHLGVPVVSTNSIGMKMVLIPPGEFMMGSPESEREPRPDETLHQVTLTQSFQIGVCEVTQSQYEKVIGANPSSIKGPDNPVEQINWDEASEFCRRLSALAEEKALGHVYRLPTEAEWEYACRAGTTTAYSFGNDTSQLVDFAWAKVNSGEKPQPVGQKKPNAWGLYDMHGNVWEWCQDWQGDLPSGAVTDPQGPSVGTNRADRGGCCSDTPEYLRAGLRGYLSPIERGSSLGFRVVCEIKSSPTAAIAPFDTAQAKAYQKAWADHLGVPVESTNSIGLKLVVIPPGEFMMGSPGTEPGRQANEAQHRVALSMPFHIGIHEVTQQQYQKIMLQNPSTFKGADLPVGDVLWKDCVEFCDRLSRLPEEKAANRRYRLPTEAEWEYACRAGTVTPHSAGISDSEIDAVAWYRPNSELVNHKVGLKKPNAWGLFDMHGNVWEWSLDGFREYQPGTIDVNPRGPENLAQPRVAKGGGAGGAFASPMEECRSAHRQQRRVDDPGTILGFRVICETPQPDVPDAASDRTSESLSQGLIAYYPFNGNAKDESGNGYDGKVVGSALTADRFGRDGNAYSFDGINSRIDLSENLFNADEKEVTIALWMKPDKSLYPYVKPIKVFQKGSENGELSIGLLNRKVDFGSRFQPDGKFIAAMTLLESERSIFVAGVYRQGKSVAIFVDGVLADEQSVPAGPLFVQPNVKTSIGDLRISSRSFKDAFQPYKGIIDDVRIYNRALSADEVKVLYEFESQIPSETAQAPPPAAIAPFNEPQAKAHQQAWADHLGVPVVSTNSIGMKFALVPAGRFEMGSPDSEPDRVGNELLHNVQISRAYGMSVFEVTQEQFESVLKEKIQRVPGDAIPAGDISWEDANKFCRQLSEIAEEKSVGRIYRLPTEAEWEFACRAGIKTRFLFGDDDRQAEKHAWLKSNSDGRPHKIGLKKPNAWGLYDMHGNVWEWCSDWFGDYPSDAITLDQVGPASGPYHVGRGGGWVHDPKDLRAAFRLFGAPTGGYPDLGFRVVLVIQ